MLHASSSSPLVQFNPHPNPNTVKLHKPFKKPLNPTNYTFKTKPLKHPPSFFPPRTQINSRKSQLTTNNWNYPDQEIDLTEDEDEGSPWEGAIVYKRNPGGVSHLEYCTTLERLGLRKLSSDLSKSRASEMGMRVVKKSVEEECWNGTPVLVSVDVTRKKGKLRLDGIVRTVLTLGCNRCGGLAAQSIYPNFTLLLSEEPIPEPETINLGVIFAEDKYRTYGLFEEGDDDDDSLIDLDDQLYFPPEQKVVDISKNIRDLIHIEITIDALCDPKCRGLCLQCGTNLNTSSCRCSTKKVEKKSYGPLGGLRKQMQQM